ncbi:RsbRD N-terminal domain-containing protein [Desulfurivibrio dismutans]|uniref:RsbRD N-terminal domain-containing protein n=1 Tax=Desulfurivibrio dismutans TaxID=1398908 RepID=UPI0023DA9321|nr:RsbRD N-terminal domain-containing protein [Desulfurivibrio alkaliphilus]MDF1615712.1 RsbRD N-terminal domain-containing protein [Desulfurivibrio alkaliphilus]
MTLEQFLAENKGELQDRWVNRVLDSYAEDAATIFKGEQDRFANPVGYNTRHTLTAIYSLLFDQPEVDFKRLKDELETFIKIRAVQTFTPASAVGFIYDLKAVVRKAVGKQRDLKVSSEEWANFHDTLDQLALVVFDLYMASRERLFQAHLNEIKTMNHMLTKHGCPSAGLADKTTQLMADVKPLHTQSNEAR